MKRIYNQIRKYAVHGQNCLLLGPTGSGKEFIAQYYYDEFVKSHSKHGIYLKYNCVATTSEMARSEMFGHKKGSYTGAMNDRKGLFEEAKNGVLFLDEIGHLPKDVQALLLRAIDPGEATRLGENKHYNTQDVIIIGATDSSPDDLLPQLLFRLGQVVEIPGLDQRPGDIPGAVSFFVNSFLSNDRNFHEVVYQLKHKIVDLLIPLVEKRNWPGNFRDLNNFIRAALINANDPNAEKFLSNLNKYFSLIENEYKTIGKTVPINPDIKAAFDNLDITWKQEEKDKWVQILSELGSKPFMRRDIDNLFSFESRTAQDRIKKLLEANIIENFGNRNDRYKAVQSRLKVQKEIHIDEKVKEKLFKLPDTLIPSDDREEEIKDVIDFLGKTDHIFLSGEPQSGKTTLALLTGKSLLKDRDVYYHELQELGMKSFIKQMIQFLIDKGYTQLEELPFFKPFMLDIDAAAMSGYIDHYFSKKKNPIFILDNLHKLKSREDLNTLQIMLKYWNPLKFIFTGDKLSNELIFGEGIRIVEFSIADPK
ncbi:MAG: sigma 54-interacting transcriptional regulator [Bacteroidetes bacterium]|nr:sigma 54-interacting transcriptional regulator [Bacteroidota bacterium]